MAMYFEDLLEPDKYLYLEPFIDDEGHVNVRDFVTKKPLRTVTRVTVSQDVKDAQRLVIECWASPYRVWSGAKEDYAHEVCSYSPDGRETIHARPRDTAEA